jgi:predicted acyltransferase
MAEVVKKQSQRMLALDILRGITIAGMILVKKVLYPRIIKNEVVGFLMMLLIALPFSLILCRIGDERIPAWVMVVSLTAVALLLTSTHLLNQFFNMNFVKFGNFYIMINSSVFTWC